MKLWFLDRQQMKISLNCCIMSYEVSQRYQDWSKTNACLADLVIEAYSACQNVPKKIKPQDFKSNIVSFLLNLLNVDMFITL